MNIIKKIKSWFNSIKHDFKLYKSDKENKKLFIESIKAQLSDRNSFFNQYNIKIDNDDYTQIVYPLSIPNEFQIAGQEWQIKDKLDETSYIVSRFLRTELGFTENIKNPDYYHLEDPTDDNVSTQYIAVWNFENQLESKKKIYIVNTILTILTVSAIVTGLLFII